MAWSNIGLLLVSGGLMFDKETVIEGRILASSLGEDIELITRIRKLMHKKKRPFNNLYPRVFMLD
jgi:hypothetical protein